MGIARKFLQKIGYYLEVVHEVYIIANNNGILLSMPPYHSSFFPPKMGHVLAPPSGIIILRFLRLTADLSNALIHILICR